MNDGWLLILFALLVGFGSFVWWRIFSKTGYPGVLGILMLVPLVNLVLVLMLAFSQWPLERRLRDLEGRSGSGGIPTS
ncbi:MAG TPA: hypothetical protein VGB20_06290 [bacterium]